MDTQNTVEIKELGTSFKIQVDENPKYMAEILEYLHTITGKIEKSTGIQDPLKISLLTSIYVIDELFNEKGSLTKGLGKKDIQQKEACLLTEKIISCIENVLDNKE